jgi:hypothetical protein
VENTGVSENIKDAEPESTRPKKFYQENKFKDFYSTCSSPDIRTTKTAHQIHEERIFLSEETSYEDISNSSNQAISNSSD